MQGGIRDPGEGVVQCEGQGIDRHSPTGITQTPPAKLPPRQAIPPLDRSIIYPQGMSGVYIYPITNLPCFHLNQPAAPFA
jgi:hypothetical protein